MYWFIKKFNRFFAYLVVISIFIINITQVVFGFLITVNYFNISDLFSSSPLFDFSFNDDCQGKSKIIFHKWEGRIDYYWTLDNNYIPTKQSRIVDQTDISKNIWKLFLL